MEREGIMQKAKIEHYSVGAVMTNCYFLINSQTRECVIIDPGGSADLLIEKIHQEALVPVAILLTHGHFDHVGAAEELSRKYGILRYIHEAENETLHDPQKNVSWMIQRKDSYEADVLLKDRERITLAGFEIEVLYTPGHTEGGCCYYVALEQLVFTGDTLFAGSVGRTDLPGGSMSKLVHAVWDKLMSLNEPGKMETDIMVYPGHNEVTTIETERINNLYL